MNVPNQPSAHGGAVATVPAVDARAEAMAVLARRHINPSQILWAVFVSALVGAAGGWLMFPEHIAVGSMAAIGWMFAGISVQQCVQLRREVNALIVLAQLSGQSRG